MLTTDTGLEKFFGKPLAINPKVEVVTFTIKTSTNFKLPPWDSPCKTCGKEGVILAGLPTYYTVTMPLPKDALNVLYEKPFFMAGEFEIFCNNGFSHTVKGLNPNPKFIISELSDYLDGFYAIEDNFEKALFKFFLGYAEILRGRKINGTSTTRTSDVYRLQDRV
jgi:hypothetical protein